ncbi:hypothetical protein [Methylobacterium radiotolerans]|uniref:Uncharacterized protein n=1 Tax=Methylobacterium radiotolerans (strain ATCC 27329 / DSM 1819 / JCM 2831 / NBRC 15690 / NCIMB 10815 / 0-1) TaxID=426355 RepID=B1M1F1_METRJ|nr:hypothetical protein [Methylobacterium radiotolerans]ACB26126.1 hypothetical protein Mrad2831_4157 [Methylobacterium radiotolerans JCM 2831]GEN01071.1 hypothetical protein MRA01_56100 [Methylobacterium radiotolerans]
MNANTASTPSAATPMTRQPSGLAIVDARSVTFSRQPQNPYLPLAPAYDDAARRAILAGLLRELDDAHEAEIALCGQVSVAASHQQEAIEQLSAASAATTAAKAAAARATADWLARDRVGERPGTTASVVAAQTAEAAAAADAETIGGALDTLRGDLETARIRSQHAREAAQQSKQCMFTARANHLAAEVNTKTAELEALRGQLRAFVRSTVGNLMLVPPQVSDAVTRRPHDHPLDGPVGEAHYKRWIDWGADLMRDPWAQFPSADD